MLILAVGADTGGPLFGLVVDFGCSLFPGTTFKPWQILAIEPDADGQGHPTEGKGQPHIWNGKPLAATCGLSCSMLDRSSVCQTKVWLMHYYEGRGCRDGAKKYKHTRCMSMCTRAGIKRLTFFISEI